MGIFSEEHQLNRRQLLELAFLVSAASAVSTSGSMAATVQPRVILGRPTNNSVAVSVIPAGDTSAYIQLAHLKLDTQVRRQL
jgi:nitrous oxide reductase